MITLTGVGVEMEVKSWGVEGALRERETDATRLGIRGRAAVAVFASRERGGSVAEHEKCIAIMEGELLAKFQTRKREALDILETRLPAFREPQATSVFSLPVTVKTRSSGEPLNAIYGSKQSDREDGVAK